MAPMRIGRSGAQTVVYSVLVAGFLGVSSSFVWRWLHFREQERMVAAIESQGVGVVREENDSFFDTAMAIWRGYRIVSLSVLQGPADFSVTHKLRGVVSLHLKASAIGERDAQAISEMSELVVLDMKEMQVERD